MMAEESNQSDSATVTPKSSKPNDEEGSSNNASCSSSTNKVIEVIDLSDVEEENAVIESSTAEAANVDNQMENGDNADDEMMECIEDIDEEEEDDIENAVGESAVVGNNTNQVDGDVDEDEDDDEEDEDDDVEIIENINNANINMINNKIQQQQQQPPPETINIDDSEDEDDEEDDDDEEEEDILILGDDEQDSSSILLNNNNANSNSQAGAKSENSLLLANNNSMSSNSNSLNMNHNNNNNNSNLQIKAHQQSQQQQARNLIAKKPVSNVNNSNLKQEPIVIDVDEEDEDEVQDLSMNNNSKPINDNNSSQNNNQNANQHKTSLEDFMPKLSEEEIGFPSFFKDIIKLGESIAVNKKSRGDIDIDKDHSILDCPSQVVPLIIKKSNKFPTKLKVEKPEEPPVQSQPQNSTQNSKNMLTISDFYASSVGKFLIGIGLSRAKQWYHKDAINKVRRQIRKEGEAEDLMEELKKQQEYLNSCRLANASYIFPTEKCEHCDFRSEFKLVLNHHMIYPHMTSRKEYKCNYCQYSTRDVKVIIDHVEIMHEKKCTVDQPPQLYECPICPHESGVKSKAATHIAKCMKFFVPEKLLQQKDDYFPTITPKPITQEDIKIYEATLQALRFAALNPQTKVPQLAGLPPGLQQQMYMVQQQQMTRIAPSRTKKQNFDPSGSTMVKQHHISPRPTPTLPMPGSALLNQMKNVATPHLYSMLSNSPAAAAAQFLPNAAALASAFPSLPNAALSLIKQTPFVAKIPINASSSGQPSGNRNSMLAVNNINNKANSSRQNHNLSSHHQNQQVQIGQVGNSKNPFVMCEICDGYIKDLDQLRTHMNWIHKVRIHPKMLASRPPLNCQKCQWRFFTDQGLERHLLGAHGLVTSNMQDMVNQNQDGGRCTICQRVFTSKLVTHMSQAHKFTLKPAHLSYKCTVCSATFNLYRLFENHVYMVHSGSMNKRPNHDRDDSQQPPRKRTMGAANGNNIIINNIS